MVVAAFHRQFGWYQLYLTQCFVQRAIVEEFALSPQFLTRH